MTDKEKFMVEWLIKHPEGNEIDAFDAWKREVEFINTFQDWDNQVSYDD